MHVDNPINSKKLTDFEMWPSIYCGFICSYSDFLYLEAETLYFVA